MNAIRLKRHLDSATLHLPEIQPLIGKDVEIIILDDSIAPPNGQSKYDAFFALSGQDVVEPDAYKQLRAASIL